MSRPVKRGDRVGAILSSDGKGVKFLGFGVYEGDFTPDDNAKGLAAFVRDMNMQNPKITLDSGKVVWGCECWWGSEAEVNLKLEGLELISVDIDEERVRQAAVELS